MKGVAYSQSQMVELLPAPARQRYEDILLQRERTRAEVGVVNGHLQDKVAHLQVLQVKRANTRPDYASDLADLDDAIRADMLAIQHADEERDRLNARGRSLDQTISQIRDVFLPSLHMATTPLKGPLRPLDPLPEVPKRSDDIAEALRLTRAEIGVIKQELGLLVVEAPTPEEIARYHDDLVRQLVALGTPSTMIGPNGKVDTTLADEMRHGMGGTPLSAPSRSASAVLAWFDPVTFRRRLAETTPSFGPGISAAARVSRKDELNDELLVLEHQEEALVRAAIKAGLEVDRRPEASGWAILSLTAEPLADGGVDVAEAMQVAAE
jgi:hypothetical protein